ncbi:MFS transporter [Neobacillus mesonae]|uniref:Tetracycline resistance protein n=1 Tax=Neobacillus mesonae TaxID=1193713 RepID=A0A3T0I4V0_9BACI|nr:MFS transporter [Neobacillus mesonae]AZU64362.1 MFS transporter [Neobacillus mesonae]
MNSSIEKQSIVNVSKIVPVILTLMIFSLVIDNSFKIISPDLVKYFGVSASTVSWQVTLAGLVIGIGAVVYSSLSDSISVRNLLAAGIILICAGSLLGFIVHTNYWLIVVSRIIQAAGLGATETLYLIFVAKYASPEDQKKYMGFSTSSYQLATVIGILAGGFVSTYLQWQNLFLIPLLSLLLLPFILKYLPKEERKKNNVDFIGLILIAAVATSIMLYMSYFNWELFILFIAAVIVFLFYITKKKNAFITIEFFKNKQFLFVLIVAFIIYSTYAAYALNTLSFLLTTVYKIKLDTVSLMFIPACLLAALVGAFSGKIGKYLSSKQCVYLAMSLITISILMGTFFVDTSIALFVISLILFSCSFALLYAPLIDTSIKKVPTEKAGAALGFYNLCINIAMSAGFTYSSFLIDKKDLQFGFLKFTTANSVALNYGSIILIIAGIALLAIILFWLLVGRKLDNKTLNQGKRAA